MTIGRFKFVIWTNNEDETFAQVKAMYDKYGWSYYHAALEFCPTTGKAHLDGYYEYQTQRKFETELKKFNKTFGKGFGDLQTARGTAGENQDYSEKENLRFETHGVAGKGQGQRTDLQNICKDITDGNCTAEDVAMTKPDIYHQYARTLHKIEDIVLRKKFRTEMTKGFWFYGPTFTGKSHKAFSGYNPETHYLWKLNDNGWQDGYTGQGVVIINDFRGEIRYNDMLNMIDKWPYTVRRRGREPAPFLAHTVIISSSRSPSAVFHNRDDEDSIEQLLRRIEVIYMDEPWDKNPKRNLASMLNSDLPGV